MKITSFAGVPFAAIGLPNVETQRGSLGMEVELEYLRRAGAEPTHVTTSLVEHEFVVMFDLVGGTAGSGTSSRTPAQIDVLRERLSALIFGESDVTAERDLWAEWHDGTVLVRPCRPKSVIREVSPHLKVTFASSTPYWRTPIYRVSPEDLSTKVNEGTFLDLRGSAPVTPRITIRPASQRTTQNADLGFKYRRKGTITNNTGQPVLRHPYRIDLGNTSTLVSSGKMRSDGRDVTMVIGGKEQGRNLRDFNTSVSYLWFIIDYLEPGDTLAWEILYGNPSVTAARGLVYPNAPAFDMDASSNSLWVYNISPVAGNSGEGVYYLNSSNNLPPSIIDYTIPGAWRPDVTLDYESRDQLKFLPFHTYDISGTTYYVARPQFYRWREGASQIGGAGDVGAPDGIVLSSPVTIQQLTRNLYYEFDASKVGGSLAKLVILSRQTSGESWMVGHTTGGFVWASGNTEPTATDNFAVGTKHIAVAIWPSNESSIGAIEEPNAVSYLRLINTFNVAFDWVTLPHTINSEETVYEYATIIRQGRGAGDATRGEYHELRVGGDRDHRIVTTLSEEIIVDCADHRATVLNSGTGMMIVDVSPAAIQSRKVAWTQGGAAGVQTFFGGQRWTVIPKRENPLTNWRFAGNILNWTTVGTVRGNPSIAYAPTFSVDVGTGAMMLSWGTTSGISSGQTLISRIHDGLFPIPADRIVALSASFRVTSVNLRPKIYIEWYDQNLDSVWSTSPVQPIMTANAWATRSLIVREDDWSEYFPPEAVYVAYGFLIEAGSANPSGTAYVDLVIPGGSDLVITDALPSAAIEVDIGFREGYLL